MTRQSFATQHNLEVGGATLDKDTYRNGLNTPTLIYENLKLVEISKIISTSLEHLQKLYEFSKLGGFG